MRVSPRVAVALSCLLASGLLGCEAVPDLNFAGGIAADSGTDGASDASNSVGCPGPNPPDGASVCCGAVPCNGDCAGHCPTCESQCTAPGTLCCAKANNVLCRPLGSVCN